jgi:hypothetical protein
MADLDRFADYLRESAWIVDQASEDARSSLCGFVDEDRAPIDAGGERFAEEFADGRDQEFYHQAERELQKANEQAVPEQPR